MKEHTTSRAWFCLRSQPKHEHIASANLKRLRGVEVFSPRLRSRKLTRRGPVWMTDSLFPNYLFAKFEFETLLDAVKYTPGVSHIVSFANRYPTVPEEIMADLRASFGNEEVQVAPETFEEGDRVIIADRSFYGMEAVVLRVLPAKDRVQVLIDMLGRATSVELKLGFVVQAAQPRPASLLNV